MTQEVSYPEKGNTLCYQLEDNSYWFTHRNRCIVSVVKRFSKSQTFLDIGGGNGFVALELQKSGFRTLLLEPNRDGVRNAKKRGLKHVRHSTFENAGFAKESVENAGIFDVIEHLDNDREFLTRIHTILKKNGMLFITVPAFQGLWSDEDVFAGHFRRYTISRLRKVLEDVGFTLPYATYFFSLLAIPIFFLRSIPSLFRTRKHGDSENYQQEHRITNGYISQLLRLSFTMEIKRINNAKYIPFGSSCLIVAQKI